MDEAEGLERKYQAPGGEGAGGLVLGEGATLAGYASLFGTRDRGGDVVQRGAYAASLAAVAAGGRRIRMLWQHDPAQPIGVWDTLREDERGLWVKGRLLPEVARGREALALLAAGAIDGLSIGYRARRAERDASGARRLLDVDLWEISLVTFPMLPEARVSAKTAAEGQADAFAQTLRAMAARCRRLRGGLHTGGA